MIETKFTEVAKQYKCDYNVNHYTVNGKVGAKIPISVYTLTLNYRNIVINLNFELGNHNLAEVKFIFYTKATIPSFDLETKDHFSRLFSFKKAPWNIKSKNEVITAKIIQLLAATGLTKIANEVAFEPHITALQSNKEFQFTTRFYLGFAYKEKTIAPVLEFHKGVIDYLYNSYWN